MFLGSFKQTGVRGHHGTQHNDTQHNYTQHNDTQHNDNQHNDTQHKWLNVTLSLNDTRQNNALPLC